MSIEKQPDCFTNSVNSVKLQPVAYQDDLGHANRDVNQAQVGNMKLACMLQDKGLSAHPDKTCFIVFGNNTFKQKIEKELKKSPLMFGKFKVTQRVYVIWDRLFIVEV